jgi:hypothetical protein
MFTVAVYLCDRAYGGPEEGGWWYDCGVPSEEHANFTRGFTADAEGVKAAADYARELNQTHGKEWNEGRREINSILSDGQYFAEVRDGNPKPYPATIPHYE